MTAMTKNEIRPQPGPQEAFLKTSADIAIYGGQAGGGKTYALLLEPLRHINNPNFGAVVFRRTSPQIRNEGALWDESEKIYYMVQGEPKESYLEWNFPSGARVKFAHMQYEKDKLDWQGAQIPFIGFDELTHFEKAQFFYMFSRNRSSCGVEPYIRATTNPNAGSWVAEFIAWWIDQKTGLAIKERSGKLRWFYVIESELIWYATKEAAMEAHPELANISPPKSVTFIPASVYDNKILLEKNPQYLANLQALPKIERERLLGGNWLIRAEGGKIYNRAWFKYVDILPSAVERRVRYWDKAGTEGGGKRTAGVLMSMAGGKIFVEHCIAGQWSAKDREQIIKETAIQDGVSTVVFTEQEPGSGGKESAESTIQNLIGFDVRADRVTGSKVDRSGPLSAQVEAGNVYLVRGDWNAGYVDEMHNFPDGKFKDRADASAGAFNKLVDAGPAAAQAHADPEPYIQTHE